MSKTHDLDKDEDKNKKRYLIKSLFRLALSAYFNMSQVSMTCEDIRV